jgi:hypothetical protein
MAAIRSVLASPGRRRNGCISAPGATHSFQTLGQQAYEIWLNPDYWSREAVELLEGGDEMPPPSSTSMLELSISKSSWGSPPGHLTRFPLRLTSQPQQS